MDPDFVSVSPRGWLDTGKAPQGMLRASRLPELREPLDKHLGTGWDCWVVFAGPGVGLNDLCESLPTEHIL